MNPALPGGAVGTTTGRAEDAWSFAAQLTYSFVPYHRMQQGLRSVDDPSRLHIDVHLATVQAFASAPSGTTIDLQLPAGALLVRSVREHRDDAGVGDLELRLRQSITRFLRVPWLGLGLTLGVVAPTGPYAPRSGAANLVPEAAYLTLGRGVAWWIAEADARFSIGSRVTLMAQLGARGPFHRAPDDFAWGAEVRGVAGVQVLAVRRWLTVLVTSEVLWRGAATEPNPFGGERLASANAGGVYWTLTPGVILSLPRGLQLLTGLRLPLLNDVTGNQLVPYPGVFFALGYARTVEPRRVRAERYQPRPGAITVVDYWADWCAPCHEIGRELAAQEPRWREVRVVRIDATRWDAGDTSRVLGAAGLPVIEIFDRAGRPVARLVGEDARRAVEVIDGLLGGTHRVDSTRSSGTSEAQEVGK